MNLPTPCAAKATNAPPIVQQLFPAGNAKTVIQKTYSSYLQLLYVCQGFTSAFRLLQGQLLQAYRWQPAAAVLPFPLLYVRTG